MTQANDIVIVSGVRTAIGTFNGSLKHTHQHDLGAAVIREAIARAGIAPQDIDETIVGNVGQIAESGFIARICQLRAGIPQESTAYSVNRQCGSGLQALADGMMQLQSGQAEVVVACGAEIMGFGPSPATRRLMDRLNIDVQSIDLIELNEAFAAQALAVMNDLRLDPARVNVNGGAIALGHPVGASGAILPVKLMYEMARSGARTGLVTMCIGGGQGISMLFEREGA